MFCVCANISQKSKTESVKDLIVILSSSPKKNTNLRCKIVSSGPIHFLLSMPSGCCARSRVFCTWEPGVSAARRALKIAMRWSISSRFLGASCGPALEIHQIKHIQTSYPVVGCFLYRFFRYGLLWFIHVYIV